MPRLLQLTWLDYLILGSYFVFVVGIGAVLKRRMKGSGDFLLSGRSIPAWVTGLAFLSANLGAQEMIGMAASGAKYGIMTCHFYWLGAIPAMVFLAIFMMPFYYGSKARSVPEYLKLRFDEKTRAFNAVSFLVMTVFSSGISLHALAKLLEILLGWNYSASIAFSAAVVLVYIFLGGLTSAIYNEVLQFFMIVLGFAPLVFLALKDVGGWSELQQKLAPVATNAGFAPGAWSHLWRHAGSPAENPLGVNGFVLVSGLGFVLSFGYWCTDFLVIQRALAARSISAARRTPLIAAVPKMMFPALVILPGMIAIALHHGGGNQLLPMTKAGTPDYNMTIPILLAKYLPTGVIGVGFTALMASFMSGMAGNVTAFNTIWTYDIYESYIAPKRSDQHYFWMGRMATVFGILFSVGAAYLASAFNNIMDMLQLVFGFVNAPLFATFLLGMFWRRTTGHGAFWGLLGGTVAAAIFHGLSLPQGDVAGIKGGWITHLFTPYSEMSQNFTIAIVAWVCCFGLTILISLVTRQRKSEGELKGLVYSLTPKPKAEGGPWYERPVTLAVLVLAGVTLLNILFW
ncbi:sodium:solute symporter family protein [Pedosphaera parvula]|uniref:SSS sodium solute transporter superfamily n=1 Tax=Pedosphaera parvula (strain Ellin514) TaxID=320771 RepID=B9XLA4_PEDPL|nr:sodium:solute symporter family protein [Pedosphaera parvula]EEF59307.1 SSS sodium solute transporter superfamily [Pedosphaera parvula Ellin514]